MDSNFYSSASAPRFLSITPPSANYLQETAKWGKFLAIVGFIMIGFMVIGAVLGGLFMGNMLHSADGVAGVASYLNSGIFAMVYLPFALLYFFPVLYLYRFSTKMQEALRLQNEELLTSSFANLKALFKFVGILTILMLAFYVLGMFFMFLGMGIGSMM
ncbi:MAG: DUF5362 family protein [Pontibacter sp.]|nr:DUF5362 family protein [Pontibacter sp.]